MGEKQIIRPEYDPDGHVYTYQGERIPGYSEIVRAVGLVKFDGIQEAILERARNVGTAVHLATRYYDENRLDMATVSPEIKGYLESYMEFREATGFKPVEIETPVMNPTYRYACTPDRVGTFPSNRKKLVVVELKKGAMYPWYHLQLQAQALCFPGNPLKYIVELKPNGKWRPHPEDKSKAAFFRSLWLGAVQIYHFAHNGGSK